MNITSILATNYKTIECSYDRTSLNPFAPVRGEKFYTYKAPEGLELQVGDAVIVNPPQGYKVVIVTAIHDEPAVNPNASYEYKWIVDKVHDEHYKARAANEALVKRALELREHKRKMQEYINQLGLTEAEIAQFKSLLEV